MRVQLKDNEERKKYKQMWELTKLKDVKVTDKYFDEALHIDVKNMLLLDPDRLLAGFRETACILAGDDEETTSAFMKRKQRYGGEWEDKLIGGHTMGHYLTALAQTAVSPAVTGKELEDVKIRLDYMLVSLKECQEKIKGTENEGFIFGAGFPTKEFRDNPLLQFENVEKGLSHPFLEAWVPWYTMHKILTGLNASFKYYGSEIALEIANALGIWIAKRTEGWTEDKHKKVLSIEYGGMNDCLYELYEINRNLKDKGNSLYSKEYERFADAAHAFDETELFERILSGKADLLNNVHANTTIPKFIGALARYEAFNSEKKYLEYAESFWDLVVNKHTYVTGGNSENEHFGQDNVLDAERTNVNNETCNTYNMLKLSRRLFAVTGKKKYLDYSARTLINAIMASQNHETGFTTYFQPMATGYHKVFNTLDGNFWCCTGTGYENFTKLQRGIFYKGDEKLLISLYIASEYVSDDYVVTMDCDFTKSDKVNIRIKPAAGKVIADDFWLRIPTWSRAIPSVRLNGKEKELKQNEGFLIVSKEDIAGGAELEMCIPFGITCENLPDGKNTYAFLYGPYVLSARLGAKKIMTKPHGIAVVASAGRSVDNDEISIVSEKSVEDFVGNIDKYLIKRDGEAEFDLIGTSKPLVFTTHFDQYTESYGIYWKLKV